MQAHPDKGSMPTLLEKGVASFDVPLESAKFKPMARPKGKNRTRLWPSETAYKKVRTIHGK